MAIIILTLLLLFFLIGKSGSQEFFYDKKFNFKTDSRGVFAVWKNLKRIYINSFPEKQSTLYKITSLIKPIMALAIIYARIDINTVISKYFDFPGADKITINHLINHNNTNYDLLGSIIKYEMKMSARDYIHEVILQGLHMRDTHFHGNANTFLITTIDDYAKFIIGWSSILDFPEAKLYRSFYFFENGHFNHEDSDDFTKKKDKSSQPLSRSFVLEKDNYIFIFFQYSLGINNPLISPIHGKLSDIQKKIISAYTSKPKN